MYKIYFGDRYILITDKNSDNSGNVHSFTSINDIKSLIEGFDYDLSINTLTIFHNDMEEVLRSLFITFSYLEAAGGVVINKYGKTLFIYRYNKWDLPKGKMEKGETPEECAIREVSEECGINGHTIIRPLPPTFHTYHDKKRLYFKKTHWFIMEYLGEEKGKPQIEEDISKIEWISESDFSKVMYNTYSSVRALISGIS